MIASYSDVSYCFSVCKLGDGKGGSEEQLEGKFTKGSCILAVKEQHPEANGATLDYDCTSECNCYAEFGMESWSDSKKYTSCMFFKGEHCCKL